MLNFTKHFGIVITANTFIKGVGYRNYFGYEQPWFITKLALLMTWFGVEYSEIETSTKDYEDTWTKERPLYLASIAFPETEKVRLKMVKYPFIKLSTFIEPPSVQQMPVLASSEEDAWDTVEKHLWDNEDYEATILSVKKGSAW